MPSKSPLLRLYDIRDDARLAQEWTTTHTRESFQADQLTFYAVIRSLEIVSEASRRIPQEVRDRHPDLPWQKIMGVSNVYRHDYDNVEHDFVWRTVQERLPTLLAAVEDEIALAISQDMLPSAGSQTT